jgi:signal transduction histidine kinase
MTDRHGRAVAPAVLQFAASGLVALVVVAVAGAVVLRHRATSESIDEAREFAQVVGEGVVEPNLSDAVLTGDGAAVTRLGDALRERVLGDRVVRVKLWTAGGRIVYSDEPRLIGSTFALADDELAALRTGRPVAEMSDLSAPENRFERTYGELLEVYYPVHTAGGSRLLFETYLRRSGIAASEREIWMAVLPVFVAALIVLWLTQAPLALSLARRIRSAQGESERLLRRAVEASDLERRRIAADLHDGVVQNLAGVAIGLAGVAERLPREVKPELRTSVLDAAASTRQSMRRLRTLLVEIYPPKLRSVGLPAALADLAAPLAPDVQVEIDAPDDLELPHEAEALLFRAAQEGLRNVAKHAHATFARVEIRADGKRAALVLEDDGCGFSAADLERRRAAGHVGVRLLADLVESAGGRLELTSEPGRGTRLLVEVPA